LIDQVPAFSRETESEFADHFQRKVMLCSQICTFSVDSQRVIEAKTRQLKDIYRFLSSAAGAGVLNDEQFFSLYSMLEVNIIRRPGIFDLRLIQQEDLPPSADPAWPHLSIVYQILLKLQCLTPRSPQHLEFARKLIPICESPDPNERTAIVSFYEYLLRHKGHAIDVLVPLFSSALRVRGLEPSGGFLVSTFFRVFNFIIDKTGGLPPADRLFRRVVLPMLAHPMLPVFQEPLSQLLDFFRDGSLTKTFEILKFILTKWPVRMGSKQVLFFEYLVSSLSRLASKPVENLTPQLSRVMAIIGASRNDKLPSVFTAFWLRPEGERLVGQHSRTLIPALFGPLTVLSTEHWSLPIRQNAKAGLAVLQRRDRERFHELMQEPAREENPPQIAKWIAIVKSARRADESMVIGAIFTQIGAVYSPASSENGRFTRPRSYSDRGLLIKPKLAALLNL
jgi:serine/threonine-protein phosphatase 2A regulatory subunit B'